MLVPHPTKLLSQRDIYLWRISLQLSLVAVALFGITPIPDAIGLCMRGSPGCRLLSPGKKS
jgi:hypothetical protein